MRGKQFISNILFSNSVNFDWNAFILKQIRFLAMLYEKSLLPFRVFSALFFESLVKLTCWWMEKSVDGINSIRHVIRYQLEIEKRALAGLGMKQTEF